MKKIFTLLLCCVSLSVNAQYQLVNADFEQWETVSYKVLTTYKGDEPVSWNSFLDGTGNLKSTAGRDQVDKISNDKRPGSTGSYCAKITARSVLGVIAQGNLTTGCVNMGSTSATDASGNYNYTNISGGKCQTFTGKPDAMHVWVKFSGSNNAKANTILHTAGYYQDPNGNTQEATLIAKAEEMNITSDANNWQELTIPFNYSVSDIRPAYALVSFSTSNTPGKGSASDYMLIDDLEYIYNSSLSDLQFNGTTISGFAKDKYEYTIDDAYTKGCLTYEKDCVGGTVSESYNANNKVCTITVMGDDIGSNSSNYHTYTITFTCDAVIEDGVTDIATMENVSKGTILLKRTFKAGWNTICLPFPSDIALLGDGVKAYTLQSVNTNGGLVFSSASTFIKNTPYLVYFPNEVKNVKFTSKTINEIRTAGSKVAGDWTFTGTYVPSISMEGKWGVVNEGGKVRKGGAGSTMKGTRAYLTYNGSASINEMRFIIDGEETNITEIDGEPLSYDVYNLNGMLVRKNATDLNGLRKGIYIVNGKKYIVK
jgi:hypothetical protein